MKHEKKKAEAEKVYGWLREASVAKNPIVVMRRRRIRHGEEARVRFELTCIHL